MMMLQEELAGKTIIGIRVESPSIWLQVEQGGWVEIRAEADCCSKAFIDAAIWHRGSGTTAAAAKNTGRRYVSIEAKADYVEIQRQRLAQGVLF